jgi:hypothetical protein
MVRIEITSDHNAFNAGYRRSCHVPDVGQELSNCDLKFSNVLCSLRFPITVSNQIALSVNRLNANVVVPNLKPREREAPGWVNAVHRFPGFCPRGLRLIFG